MKRKKAKAKRRLVYFGTLSLFIIGYFIFNLCFYAYRITVLKTSKENLEVQLSTLEEEEKKLTTDIQKLKDPEYIASYARENYMYSKDGEYIIKIEEKENEVKVIDDSNNYSYLMATGVVLLLLVILYIIKKIRKK